MPTFKLIVGLGNPGGQYLFTRHNVGFMILDAWADEDGAAFRDERARFSQAAQLDSGERLVKPMTYMNESGRAVAAWLDWLKLTPADLLVVVDDVRAADGPGAPASGGQRRRPQRSALDRNPPRLGRLRAVALRRRRRPARLADGALGAVSIYARGRGRPRADDPHGAADD
ncbi:MAG: aminoacyl-tRNA hydrolase [Verrucomicrobiota bacterium]